MSFNIQRTQNMAFNMRRSSKGVAVKYQYVKKENPIYKNVLNNTTKKQPNSIIPSVISNTNTTPLNIVNYYQHYAHHVQPSAYAGSVYCPSNNKLYFVPFMQGPQEFWHYVDCDTDKIEKYKGGSIAVQYAYMGGVYMPTLDRIYFYPAVQSQKFKWHYIDCKTNEVVTYLAQAGILSANAYRYGVFCPLNERVYLAPHNQAKLNAWHYIHPTGKIIRYDSDYTGVQGAYSGGAYCPINKRIYFAPACQAPEPIWHYIDCVSGKSMCYPSVENVVKEAYSGAVYCPKSRRIYFIPYKQAHQDTWHYFDSKTRKIIGYKHKANRFNNPIPYFNGVYCPDNDRIYLSPFAQSKVKTWHYIECKTNEVHTYNNTNCNIKDGFIGGSYSPTTKKIYFSPYNASSQPAWVSISC